MLLKEPNLWLQFENKLSHRERAWQQHIYDIDLIIDQLNLLLIIDMLVQDRFDNTLTKCLLHAINYGKKIAQKTYSHPKFSPLIMFHPLVLKNLNTELSLFESLYP